MKNMKKLILSVFAFSALVLSACSGGTVEDTSSTAPAPATSSTPAPSSTDGSTSTSALPTVTVTLNETFQALDEGDGFQLVATTDPANSPVSWESDDAEVATVDQEGNVKAVKEGTATITATSGSCNIDNIKLTSAETGISTIITDEDNNAPAYNLMGVPVGNDYRGIVIINGRKVIRK